jgi:hypothetical protein
MRYGGYRTRQCRIKLPWQLLFRAAVQFEDDLIVVSKCSGRPNPGLDELQGLRQSLELTEFYPAPELAWIREFVPQMEGCPMRKLVLSLAATAALFVFPIAGFSQSVEIGPGGVRVDDGRARPGGGQCEQLRLACENKDRLGERGEGNCRTYRETCQRPVARDVCGELRAACLNKDKLGEQGEGNCRRYRATCRGRQ